MSISEALAEYEERRVKALAMGKPDALKTRKAAGILNARERVAYLVDPESFIETGLFGTSSVYEEHKALTPADGKVTGYARIRGRDVAVVSNDFTALGASSSHTNRRKTAHIKRVATEWGMPVVMLSEASGARLPDTMGAAGMSALYNDYRRTRETPWASAVLGYCFGNSAFYTCCSDFRVMRSDAVLAVSSPRLVSQAVGEAVDAQELGGSNLHAEHTGLVDLVVDTDQQALDAIKQFLSYLPSHQNELPPRSIEPVHRGGSPEQVVSLLPDSRTQVYDARKLIKLIADRDSCFELKGRFGKPCVTALARLDGHSVGFIANNPRFSGGSISVEACEKITSFLVLCDSFNIPIVMLVDTPGFMIGSEAEKKRALGKLMNFINALALCTVPRLSIILRKSYGQAYLNMGGGKYSDEIAAWPIAEVSFMDPRFAVTAIKGLKPKDEGYVEALQSMQRNSAIWDMASHFAVHSVIHPADTRDYLIRMLDVYRRRRSNGIGKHLLSNWPTSY